MITRNVRKGKRRLDQRNKQTKVFREGDYGQAEGIFPPASQSGGGNPAARALYKTPGKEKGRGETLNPKIGKKKRGRDSLPPLDLEYKGCLVYREEEEKEKEVLMTVEGRKS